MELENLRVSATIIVISKDRKALIVQRPPDKAFPNKWTVAGGKLQDTDGIKISDGFRYHSVEYCARRELYEETGILISSMNYLCSITAIWEDIKRVILSYYVVLDADVKDIEIKLSECQDYEWITESEISKFDFIPDIGGEIKEVFKILKDEHDYKLKRRRFKCLGFSRH